MHHVLRTTEYKAQLYEKNGKQASSPPTETTTITVTEVDCHKSYSEAGYRCFKHLLTQAEQIEDVGGLKLAVFDGPGGAGTQEITLCNGDDKGDTNGKIDIKYTTCKGDIYVFFYGDDPRPMMLCYNGEAYRPTSLETYCRQWVRLNNGTTGAKNGQGTPVDCLCQDAGGGGQKPKFNSAPLLAALYRVSLFLNPVKLCLTQQAITAMKHKREGQSDQPSKPAKPLEHLYTIDKNPPQCIQVRIVPRDLSCYRCYTHKTAKEGFRLGEVTYAEANEGGSGAAQTPSQPGTCSASTAGQPGQTCSAAPGTTPSEPFCFPYPLDRQLLTVSTYYYMYDSCHNWPLVVELGFRGLASEFFRLCCTGNGQPGNGGAQTANGACKSPKGLKWVLMSEKPGSPAPTRPKDIANSCCPDGSNTQGSDSTTQNGDCKPCPPNTQGNTNNEQDDEKAETCRLDREFVERVHELYGSHRDVSVFARNYRSLQNELTDLVERRAYEIRKGLKLDYGDKTEDKLILETASNCWEGWPLDYMVGGGVLGVAGGGGWKVLMTMVGFFVKL